MTSTYGPARPPEPSVPASVPLSKNERASPTWNGLPVEVKRHVVECLLEDARPDPFQALIFEDPTEVDRLLRGLSRVDRASYALCVPYLYRVVRLPTESLQEIKRLARSTLPRYGAWVRRLFADGEEVGAPVQLGPEDWTREPTMSAFQTAWLRYFNELLAHVPNLESLDGFFYQPDRGLARDSPLLRISGSAAVRVRRMAGLRDVRLQPMADIAVPQDYVAAMLGPQITTLSFRKVGRILEGKTHWDEDDGRTPVQAGPLAKKLLQLENLQVLDLTLSASINASWARLPWRCPLTSLGLHVSPMPLHDMWLFVTKFAETLVTLTVTRMWSHGRPSPGAEASLDIVCPALRAVHLTGDLSDLISGPIARCPNVESLLLDIDDLWNRGAFVETVSHGLDMVPHTWLKLKTVDVFFPREAPEPLPIVDDLVEVTDAMNVALRSVRSPV